MNGADAGMGGGVVGGLIFAAIMLGFAAVMIAATWKVFTKAGHDQHETC